MPTSTTSWGEPVKGLRLGVALERGLCSPGDTIDLTLALRNESERSLTLVESHLLREYRFLVTLRGNGEVDTTDRAQRILRELEAWSGARRVSEIPAHTLYELPWKAPLHEWFEIGRPGTYSVQAQRPDWREDDAVLTSGIVRFEVK